MLIIESISRMPEYRLSVHWTAAGSDHIVMMQHRGQLQDKFVFITAADNHRLTARNRTITDSLIRASVSEDADAAEQSFETHFPDTSVISGRANDDEAYTAYYQPKTGQNTLLHKSVCNRKVSSWHTAMRILRSIR